MDKYISDFMAATIETAALNPLAPFGAIIVYDNKDILLKSVNSAHHNPVMHGELSVIHTLFNNGFNRDVSKLSLYTTAEPCPMCAAAIYWAMIPKLIYGTSISFCMNCLDGKYKLVRKKFYQKRLIFIIVTSLVA